MISKSGQTGYLLLCYTGFRASSAAVIRNKGLLQLLIKAHFAEDITPADLAKASNFSPWYARKLFIQTVEKPARKVIIKRGIKATEYWSYCEEVGCDVWGLLNSIKSISGEPVCLWLPEYLRKPITNEYVQGVEVKNDYAGIVPDGFEVIDLPAATYLLFRGEPFEEEKYESAIVEIWDAEKKYDSEFIGYKWDDMNPRIQLEPRGNRGYIELVPVRKKNYSFSR